MKTADKKVSIITATFNCISRNNKSYFYEMFRSIHEQDYPNIEHVIIDGGSKDGSVDFINNLIEKYGKKEIIFISEKDKGINDATNKGFNRASGEYITLMCDDDFYIQPYAISKMMEALNNNNADYVYSSTWWLNRAVWTGEAISFAWRHPFLINACIFRKNIFKTEPYLDIKYPMVGDYDFFMRLIKQPELKEVKVDDVLTVLRPGGFSQSSNNKYIKEIEEILGKHFDSKHIKGHDLWQQLHQQRPSFFLLLKIKMFCPNEKIKASVFNAFGNKKYIIRRIKTIIKKLILYSVWPRFIKIGIKNFRQGLKKNQLNNSPKILYSTKESRMWIETFYEDLY